MGVAAAIGRSVNIPIIVRSLGHELYRCQLTLNNGFKPSPDLLAYLDGNLSGNGRDDPHLLVEDFHVPWWRGSLTPQKYTGYLSFATIRTSLMKHRQYIEQAYLTLEKEPLNESEELNKPAYSWHSEVQSDRDDDCTRCRLYRAVSLGVYDQLRDVRNFVHACEIANEGERDLASRRASGFNDLFQEALMKEMDVEANPSGSAPESGQARGSGPGSGKVKKSARQADTASLISHTTETRPADKWVWGVNLTTEDIQKMIRGSDRYYQIPHSGYDDELRTGKLAGRQSPIPNPDDLDDPDDPNVVFDELSTDIREVRDLDPDEFSLAFLFPPLHYTAASDSGSRPDLQDFSKAKSVGHKQSPSGSYSGSTIPTRKPPHRPWLVPPPVGYVKPPSLFPDVPRRVQPSPSRARSDDINYHETVDSSLGQFSINPNMDQFLHSNRMDCSDDVADSDDGGGSDDRAGSDDKAGSDDGAALDLKPGDEGHVQIPVGNLGRIFVSDSLTSPSPDDSALMYVEMPESDPEGHDDIYETDASTVPPSMVYISDVDEEEDFNRQEDITMDEDPDVDVLLSVYMPGSDPDQNIDPAYLSDTGLQPAGAPTSTISIPFRDPLTGQYTADSFSHFSDEWLE